MASADAPDPDTDESWRLYGSSNALFRTQTPDVHFGRVGADNSPDHFSAYLPNILTEFVFPFLHHAQHLLTGHF